MRSPETGKRIALPLTEYLKSIPELVGVRVNEEPRYEALVKDGDFEIRRYEPMATATVAVDGEGEEARGEAFRRLAAFIFGENHENETLAMTSPVFEAGRTMTFVLPRRVLADGVPSPIDPSISVVYTPARTVAAVRYSGEPSDESYRDHREKLMGWLETKARFRAKGEPFGAAYDPPASLDATKRNEVQIEVSDLH